MICLVCCDDEETAEARAVVDSCRVHEIICVLLLLKTLHLPSILMVGRPVERH